MRFLKGSLVASVSLFLSLSTSVLLAHDEAKPFHCGTPTPSQPGPVITDPLPSPVVRDHRHPVNVVVRDHRQESNVIIRDHRTDSGVIVRDHRDNSGPIIRDHRNDSNVIVRDHRNDSNVIVRDHRTPVFPTSTPVYNVPVFPKDVSSASGGVVVTGGVITGGGPIIRDHRGS